MLRGDYYFQFFFHKVSTHGQFELFRRDTKCSLHQNKGTLFKLEPWTMFPVRACFPSSLYRMKMCSISRSYFATDTQLGRPCDGSVDRQPQQVLLSQLLDRQMSSDAISFLLCVSCWAIITRKLDTTSYLIGRACRQNCKRWLSQTQSQAAPPEG